MNAMYQGIGGLAIALGLFGTWLAAKQRTGWLLCIVSSTLWLPALVTGDQWAAVGNCGLSIAICVRNFAAQAEIDPLAELDLRDEAKELVRSP
jgi:hypothetical protein